LAGPVLGATGPVLGAIFLMTWVCCGSRGGPVLGAISPHTPPSLTILASFGIRISGFGFGVWSLGLGVQGSGFGVWGLGFRVWGLGCRNEGFDLGGVLYPKNCGLSSVPQANPLGGGGGGQKTVKTWIAPIVLRRARLKNQRLWYHAT